MSSSTIPSAQGDVQNENNIIVSTWLPDFIGWLKDAGQPGKPRLHSECPICYKLLDISTDVGEWCTNAIRGGLEVTAKDVYDQMQLEPAAVVPCGHVIGSKCFAAWAQISKQCPICRKDIACSSCHERVPAPLCSPFKTNQDGVYSFFPYDAILQYIPKTESEWDSPPGKIYCGKCVSEQAVVLMTSTLIGNLDCSLCLDKGTWFWSRESFDQHRAVRQQAADTFFRSRLLDVYDLIRPPVEGMRPSEYAEEYASWIETWKRENSKELRTKPWVISLRRRIFGTCRFTGDVAEALSHQDLIDMSLLSMIITRMCYTVENNQAWFTGIDEAISLT
ncbi:hypothetical protein PG997_000229 [Apiospora hydei]|uniref:RING-type domain-containing protein n=1 Tax=Apiospora hydei TaxID=1337664 RepID=A0ABR1XAC8_9PEZI